MMDLPPTGTDKPPAFLSAEQCRAWLAATPLANAVQAQALLLRQIGLLNRHSLPAAERLAILELLEGPVTQAQGESGRKFAGRPLPLAPPEQAAYDSCLALWQAMTVGYLRCLEACRGNGAPLRLQAATVIVQALHHAGAAQLDTYRGGRRPGADFWRLVHELYAAAEALAVVQQPDASQHATPLAAYGEILLLEAAAPNELDLRRLGWVKRWAHRWAGKLTVLATPPAPGGRAAPLCVDLAGEAPASHHPAAGEGVRWLDTSELRRSIGKRLKLLEEGQDPSKLQLGDDCFQPACGRTLERIYRAWCKGGGSRWHERHPAGKTCFLVSGFEAMHYHIAGGKPFRPPGRDSSDLLRREREEIATFGRVASRRDEALGKQAGYRLEEWQVIGEWDAPEESATGLHLALAAGQSARRFGTGQLVAARPADARGLLLGSVRWAAIDEEDRLHLDIRIFPGQPTAIALRPGGLAAGNEPYQQAFLLPATPALGEPATVIAPVGCFKRERTLEAFTDRAWQMRLSQLLERGADYDRITYEC